MCFLFTGKHENMAATFKRKKFRLLFSWLSDFPLYHWSHFFIWKEANEQAGNLIGSIQSSPLTSIR